MEANTNADASTEMKTYVWTGVLTDWTSGMAVVTAASVEDAQLKMLNDPDLPDYVKQELAAVTPTELASGKVEYIYGGA
ncbi:hypothetical protein I7X12_07780 [Halosimplex litoreum]|uniref:Uncharacterized protein n=1 Tax=Halosimplex litoreum TaxID=1198301 RepID=A0A7T3KX16_9EURY|nr:hypothetical protein [Halosimplex litoreum]QPV64500.1 hypothetical protein I7X12_07780 [Halosimplex litoreum]